MKVKLLLILLSLITVNTFAQEKEKFKIEKGSWNYSGQLSLNFSAVNGGFDFVGDIKAQVGYTIKDNLVLGIGLGSFNSDFPLLDNSNNSFEMSGASVFTYLKKYYPISEKLAFTLQGEIKYSFEENEINYLTAPVIKNDVFSIGVRPGFTYFLSKNIALETNLGFVGYSFTHERTLNNNTHKFGLDLDATNVTFGVLFNF